MRRRCNSAEGAELVCGSSEYHGRSRSDVRDDRESRARWELLAEMDALAETRFIPQMARAVIYLGLADHESALACLEAACRQRELPLASTGVHPLWNPLRGYPRFKELLGRIGLDVLA